MMKPSASSADLRLGAKPPSSPTLVACPASDRPFLSVWKISAPMRIASRQLSAPTDNYPINQWRIVDLASTPFAEGVDVRPLVHAQAGNDVPGNVFVSYCVNGQTATYTASGTTTNYTVTLLT